MTVSLTRPSKCGLISILFGLIFLIKALLCVVFYLPIQTFVELLMEKELALTPETHMLRLWSDPPLTPKLKIFIFNVTNPDEILAGKVPVVEELGPYVYSAHQTKNVSGWSESGNVINFRSRTLYKFLPLESPRQDNEIVVLPNLVMMTGMMKPEVTSQLSFIKRQVVWPLLMSDGHKTPFVKVKVSDFLWGYEDELACLAGPEIRDNDDDMSGHDSNDNWDFWSETEVKKRPEEVTKPEVKQKFVKKRNFRRPDGRCMFGVLAEKNYTWEGTVSMMSGKGCLTDKGKILDIDGATNFEIWEEDSKCDSIAGAQEPSATPPVIQSSVSSFDLHIGIMCRKVKLSHTSNVNYTESITTKRFTPSSNTFNLEKDPKNGCYKKGQNPVLPAGALGVQSCAEGSPIAVSFPHFLHGDKWYREQVHGISDPDPVLHEMYLDLEPQLGAPVGIQIRFQLNLLLQKDPDFPPLANLGKNLTVLPIFWAQEGYELPPPRALFEMELALSAPTLISSGLAILCLVVGGLLILFPTVICIRNSYRTKKRTLVLSSTSMSTYVIVPQQEQKAKSDL